MAAPAHGPGYSLGALTFFNDGGGAVRVSVFRHDYDSAGTGEPQLIRQQDLTAAQVAALITAIQTTE